MEEMGFYYHPEIVTAQLRAEWRVLQFRVISCAVFAGIAGVLWAVFREQAELPAGGVIGFSLLWLIGYGIWAAIRISRVRSDRKHTSSGLAIGLNRNGLMFAHQWFYWQQVAVLTIKPGGMGSSERLVLTTREGQTLWLPLMYTDATTAVLEQSVRLLSSGLARVDLSKVEV